MRKKVFIIGAGTAGLITARELARKGIDTYVFDQKKQPGYPATASGIISIKGLESIKTSYKKSITNKLYGARLHAGNTVMEIKAKKPIANVVDRVIFNDLLLEEAGAAGAKIILGKRVSEHELDIYAKEGVVVGADGAVSSVAKHFEMGNVENYVLTYKAEYEVDVENTGSVDLFFDSKNSKGLFGWICPNSKRILEIGIGINPGKFNSKIAFERFLLNKEVYQKIEGAELLNEHASIIPMKLRNKIADDNSGVVLVGDAAGQVKPSTGGGIVFGGNAAILAAEIIHGYVHGTAKLSEYQKLYRKKYVFDTRVHALLNRFYSNTSEKGLSMTMRVLNNLGMSTFLSEYGDMDSPKSILKNIILRRPI